MSLADELEGMIAEMNAAEANRLAARGEVFGKGTAGVVEGKSASQWADRVSFLRAQIQGHMFNNKDAILTALREQEKTRIAQINAKVRNKISPEEWRDACAGLGHKV